MAQLPPPLLLAIERGPVGSPAGTVPTRHPGAFTAEQIDDVLDTFDPALGPRESLGTRWLAFTREGAEHRVLAEPAPKHPRLVDHGHAVVIGGGKHGVESAVEGRSG